MDVAGFVQFAILCRDEFNNFHFSTGSKSKMVRKLRGKTKGEKMIKEIQRLKNLGLGSEAIGRTLGVSRNTVRKYLKTDLIAAQSLHVSRPTYQAEWSKTLCWKEIKAAADHGKPLRQYWEEQLQTADND